MGTVGGFPAGQVAFGAPLGGQPAIPPVADFSNVFNASTAASGKTAHHVGLPVLPGQRPANVALPAKKNASHSSKGTILMLVSLSFCVVFRDA